MLSIASCKICSYLTSRAPVASINSNIFGSFSIDLANAIFCICPPDSCDSCSPTMVSSP
ncbi:hypothetical protein MA16_Dca024663 [Dendrobium catenatum]|uniref:Uncharacterized protein n=1 Tax=Dendrobium catenatum TaxID=906689 RepID=A0A2I0WG31_9ASPA|nr:hypothetical protein MA16_Dca024663 [Dendrobium catenatum]